jgi:membrane-associated phospholipid phosphatase
MLARTSADRAADNFGLSIAMSNLGYIVNFVMTIIMIVGGYQFYFLVQRRHLRNPIEFAYTLDDLIPFQPGWVWIYSGLYYPIIILLVFTIPSFAKFNYTAFSFITLLIMQLVVFFLFPVKIPKHWRNYDQKKSLSTRFLAFVHSYDGLPNSIPSMHVSVSTLTALHLYQNLMPEYGYVAQLAFLFPLLISASALFTKQHYVVDIIPGVLFGYVNFEIFRLYVS